MATQRITGRRLQRIRQMHLMQNPLCVVCKSEGKVTLATEIDHIKALVNGGEDVEENRQGLCRHHHLVKTRQDMGYVERAEFDDHGRVKW